MSQGYINENGDFIKTRPTSIPKDWPIKMAVVHDEPWPHTDGESISMVDGDSYFGDPVTETTP